MPPPRHAKPSRLPASAPRYIGALVVATMTIGVGVATAGNAPEPRIAAVERVRLTTQTAPRVVERVPSPAAVKPTVKKPVVAAKKPVAKKKRPAAKVTRWLPTGTGLWLHEFDQSQGGDGRAIVARAKSAGLTHLFVQTGSSKKGLFGKASLRQILPATKGTGIRVIAWDFPTLHNPEADARRLALAARYRCGGCPRVAAVAPDVETASEGTKLNASRVIRYYTELRKWLPRDMAILATVPWPSEMRRGKYPYASTALRSDAMLPMAYWYNRSPQKVTAQSMAYLKQFKKPVMPVGQGYDGRLDAPYLKADPHPFLSVRSFFLTAHQWNAQAVSLWSWQTMGSPAWQALAKSKALYRSR